MPSSNGRLACRRGRPILLGALAAAAPRPRRRCATDRHRLSRRARLPARAHARLLSAGDPDGRGLHRARPGLDEGPSRRRPSRERPHGVHLTSRRTPSSPPARRRSVVDGVSHTGWFTGAFTLTEPGTLRASSAALSAGREHRVQRALPGSRRSRRSSTSPSPTASGSTPRRSTRPTSTRSGCRSRSRSSRRCAATGATSRRPRCSPSPRGQTSASSTGASTGPSSSSSTLAGAPADYVAHGIKRTYDDLVTLAGQRRIATYADGIGPDKSRIVPTDDADRLQAPTTVVRDAHRDGLLVHPFTFRPENQFLPASYRQGVATSCRSNRARQRARRAASLLPPRRRRRLRGQRRHRGGRPGRSAGASASAAVAGVVAARGPRGSPDVVLGPRAQLLHGRAQRAAELRERVLDLRRDLLVGAAGDEPVALERAQRLREHLRRDAAERIGRSENRIGPASSVPWIISVHLSAIRSSRMPVGDSTS